MIRREDRLNILVVTLVVASMCLAASAQTCVNPIINNLVIQTENVVYATSSQTVPLRWIVVSTRSVNGAFIATGAEVVTVVPPVGMTVSGTKNLTTTNGLANFTDLGFIAARGTYLLGFKLCNGVRTDYLQLVVRSNAGVQIIWTAPVMLNSITSYGYIPIRPTLAYADALGNVTDMPSLDPWTLAINNSVIGMNNFVFQPTLSSGQIASFRNLSIGARNVYAGTVLQITLLSIGSLFANNTQGIKFPPPLNITIAYCNSDFSLSPSDPRATLKQFNVLFGSGVIGIKGWAFLPQLELTARCRYNGLSYPIKWVDICNINCIIPVQLGPNTAQLLEYSPGGVVFQPISNVSILNTTTLALKSTSPAGGSLFVMRDTIVNVTAPFSVVDALGTPVFKFLPNSPMLNVTCTTQQYFATQKRLFSTYVHPFLHVNVTPNYSPAIVNGSTSVDFAFGQSCEGDLYVYCCTAPGIQAGCVNVNVLETCPSPPFVWNVSSPSCTVIPNGDLVNCSTNGWANITVVGGNFGRSNVSIRIGPYLCASVVHDPIDPARIIYGILCRGIGQGLTLYVMRPIEQTWGQWNNKFSYSVVPQITSISGCASNYYPSTANCRTDGTDTVQIVGDGFGNYGSRVFFYYYVPPGATYRIEALSVTTITPQLLNATGFPGQGTRFAVAVQTLSNETFVQTEVTLSYAYSVVIPCPSTVAGMCNLRGNCNYTSGLCRCFSDAVNGLWMNTSCNTCQPNYYGSSCTSYCPTDASGATCGGPLRGTCSSGVTGNGVCTCSTGLGGISCNMTCPNGAALPCSGHGTCTQGTLVPTCVCFADSTRGFWNGSLCNVCAYGYVGSNCTLACPQFYLNPGKNCMGIGNCSATAKDAVCSCPANTCGNACELTGSSCGACPAGYYGANCTQTCPGFGSINGVCSSSGVCLGGTQGSGACVCSAGFSGTVCEKACPIANGLRCSGHGQCDAAAGVCVCDAYYGTADCSVPCPGLGNASGVCSSAGVCSQVTSTCTCSTGWAGMFCDIPCAGGVLTPCNNHGQCLNNGSCVCSNNSITGYFGASDCSICQPTWFGPFCNRQCVKNAQGQQCNNKGKCLTSSVTCSCNNDIILGFWAEPNCTVCKPNYFGPNCTYSCPGGACNSCSQNGICFDGLTGNGTCKCFFNTTAGFWAGSKCDICAPSYYGITCALQCPFSNTRVCGGHGTCSEGLRGTGACACDASSTAGFWMGTACDVCATGYFGPRCTQRCNGFTGSSPCSGHGTCNGGFTGDGNCTCAAYYGQLDCSASCPFVSNQVCNGHGACEDGANRTGTCRCFSASNQGYWDGTACTLCASGFYGANCILPCPSDQGQVCAGHGVCDEGASGTGKCTCQSGWSGVRCSRPCDGGAANPCTGHGSCQQDTGSCVCYQSTTFGYWSGQNCTECNSLYLSSDCTVPCPLATVNDTVACNGVGTCFQGLCSNCPGGYCGDACQSTGDACAGQICAQFGYWGPTCTNQCPALNTAANTTCSDHGVCSQGVTGTGLCNCYSGYWGSDCSHVCPGGASTPCNNFGSCNAQTGQCVCLVGYATADCSVVCPGGATNVCSSQGVCSSATGVCACFTGYGKLDCSSECPGGARNPCNQHGVCNQTDATCLCASGDTTGYWAGSACQDCASPYFGSTCTSICIHGKTVGQACVCDQYYSGPACDSYCPTSAQGAICSNHGTCLWGNNYTAGTCQCDPDYYSANCLIQCSIAMCQAAPYFLAHAQCNNMTGTCECASDSTNGFWAEKNAAGASTLCTACQRFYWGQNCDKPCNCLQRGTCDQNTGQCQCFNTDALGHYAGTSCQTCAAGFIGALCNEPDVVITRQRPCSTIISITDKSGFTLVDSANGFLITGGRPLILCNLTTKTFIRDVNTLNATVLSGYMTNGEYYLLLSNLDSQTDKSKVQIVTVARGANPTFTVLQRGNIASPYQRHFTALEIGDASGANFMPQLGVALHRRASSLAASVLNFPVVAETIQIATTQQMIVTSDCKVTQINGLTFLPTFDCSSNFLSVFGADMTSNVLINPSVLIVGGNDPSGATWRLMGFPMQLGIGNPIDISAILVQRTTFCVQNGCLAVGKLVVDGTYVIAIVLTNSGAGIIRFRYTALMTNVAVEFSIILSSYTNTSFNVTALTLDTYGAAGYVAINLANSDGAQPSVIYRFSLVTLAVSGTVSFQKVVDAYEVVTAIVGDQTTRTLYAVIPLSQQISVVPLNLFAVTSIFPNIADTYGGTLVTVQGEGFANLSVVYCNFNGTIVPGQYVSSEEIHCTAPSGGDERCSGVPLEVTVAPGQFTNNQVALRRVSSPRISKVFNQQYGGQIEDAYGSLSGGALVVLEGFGFQNTYYFACRFLAPNEVGYSQFADFDFQYSGGTQGVRYNNAVFVNTTQVYCKQPPLSEPTQGPATVEVTLDGTVYSRSGLTYEIVGPAQGLLAFTQDSASSWYYNFSSVYTSDARVDLANISIWVVDSQNQRLRLLDSSVTRSISVSMLAGSFVSSRDGSVNLLCVNKTAIPTDPNFYSSGQTQNVQTANGFATFSGMYFLSPPAGSYTLTFIEQSAAWEYNFSFVIVVGNAYKLVICTEPSNQTNNLQPTLKQQPSLYAEDFAGNQLTAAALQAQLVHVTASYLYETTQTRAVGDTTGSTKILVGIPVTVAMTSTVETRFAQIKNNYLQFEGIEMQGLYGRTYYINFTAPGLINTTSTGITVQWCNNNTAKWLADSSTLMYFAKWNTSECFVCPPGGFCDGTPNIQASADNLWRADSDSYVFYSCATPYAGDSCLAPNGTCKKGYDGPRCSSCVEGYGKNGFYCEVCPASGTIVGFATLIVVIALAFVALVTWASLTSYAVDALPAAIRLTMNYLQVSSRINFVQNFPTALTYIYIAQWDISELIRFDAIPVECVPLHLSVYKQFYFAVGIPFLVLGVCSLGLIGLNLYRAYYNIGPKFIPVPFSTGGQKVRRERVMLAVARFMSRIRAAASDTHGDLRRDDLRPQFYTSLEYFTAIAVVVFTLCYPSIVQWCMVMWKCESVISGDAETLTTHSVLILDRTIDCDTPQHKAVQFGALAAALFYGLVVPAMSCFLISRSWWEFGGLHARRLFSFLVCGYDREMWWWEITVAARKFIVIVIIMVISDSVLRTYLMMWTLAVSLGLHGWLQPFDTMRPSLYYLDGFGITTIVLTLNLSLLFQFPSFAEGTTGNTALVIILLAMNIFATCTYLAFLGRHTIMRIRYAVFQQEEDVDTSAALAPVRSFRQRASTIFGTDAEEAAAAAQKRDRKSIQQEGVLGLLRRASVAGKNKEEPAKVIIDPTSVPVSHGETPFERLKRLEAERRKQFLRRDQAKTQAELEEELNELKERLARAEALSKAEEAVIRRNPHMAERRKQHEAELMKLMDLIRKERGEISRDEEHMGQEHHIGFEDEDEDEFYEEDY